MNKPLLRMLFARDKECWHCGEDRPSELVPHHRKNRGAGGRKSLDRIDNLILVCAIYNGEMESNSKVANLARHFGHKLRDWQDFSTPAYNSARGMWYILGENGKKYDHFEEN